MQQRNFYLVADYKEDGKHRNGQYIIQAEDEQNAVCWLLWELKKSGADVLLITSVYGVNSIQELKEAAEWETGCGLEYWLCHIYAALQFLKKWRKHNETRYNKPSGNRM